MTQILTGTVIAQQVTKKLQHTVALLKQRAIVPTLATIVVGNNNANLLYAQKEQQQAQTLGLKYLLYRLPESTSQQQLQTLVETLNNDLAIDAILLQLPLPVHISTQKALQLINPQKDVDGLSPLNMGKLWLNLPCNIPATARAIMTLLRSYQIALAQQHVVILSRSNIVGKPLAALLLQANATVTIAHSQTNNLSKITQSADILIVAVGVANFLTAEYVQTHTIVIDVGTNYSQEGQLVGDVNFKQVRPLVHGISPVPGGIGPLTVVSMFEQVVEIAKKRVQKHE